MRFTTAEAVAEPQVMVYVLCAVIVGAADPLGIEQVGAAPEATVLETPGPEIVQDALFGTFDAVQEMVDVCPARTRVGDAVMVRTGVPVQVLPVTVTFGHMLCPW